MSTDKHDGEAAAAQAGDALVDRLCADWMIIDPAVERAFRTVPRHVFVPAGTSLQMAYDADDSVAIKHDGEGS